MKKIIRKEADIDQAHILRRSFAIIMFVVAVWEIFLRLDSQILTTSAKLWFFPLAGSAFIAIGTMFGHVLGRVVFIPFRGKMSTRILFCLVVGFGALTFSGEYICLMKYHAPWDKWLWPLAAVTGATFGFIILYCLRRVSLKPGRQILRLILMLAALSGFVIAMIRPDIGYCVIRRNTAAGRFIGRSMARLFKPRLPKPGAEVIKNRDFPSSAKIGFRNIFLFSVDTLRTDFLSVYSQDASPTVHINEFSKRSVVFEDAFASRSTSAPSMASILTGLYPARHGVWNNAASALKNDITTLAEMLSAEAYATAGFVTNVNFSTKFNFQQGFDVYEYFESKKDPDGLILDSTDSKAVEESLIWAASHTDKKMFVWVHIMAPHSPYLPPEDLRPILQPGNGRWFNVLNMHPFEARVEGLKTYFDKGVYNDLYAAEVASSDRLFGRFIDGLTSLGLLDDAHFIFLSDHGEAFGEADVFQHGYSLNPVETRVPFIWKLPGDLRGGTRVGTTIQLTDLVPTLWDISFHKPFPSLDGRILSGLMLGEASEDTGFAFSEAGFAGRFGSRGIQYSARDKHRAIWLNVEFPYAVEFNRKADPWETHWRSYETLDDDSLFNSLLSLAIFSEDQRSKSTSSVTLDEDQKKRLRALGYLN